MELTCPNCSNVFTSATPLGSSKGGRQHTDFHVSPQGTQLLPYLVHLCQHCGYAAAEEGFSLATALGRVVKQRVWDELAPHVPSKTPTGSEKYEFAAKVALWENAEPRRLAELWLRAAWCCEDEGDVEAERYFRRFAARTLEEALSTYDGLDPDERPLATYLVGELWRRVGDVAQANEWFSKVADEVTQPRTQYWIVRLAERQKEDPQEWFA